MSRNKNTNQVKTHSDTLDTFHIPGQDGDLIFTSSQSRGDDRSGRNPKRARANTGGESVSGEADINTSRSLMTNDQKLDFIIDSLNTYDRKVTQVEKKLDLALSDTKRIASIEHVVQTLSDRITLLDYKTIDMEARDRRNNLIFKGFVEKRGEDCTELVASFLQDKLGIEDHIPTERAHRFGKFGLHPRPIIVAFSFFRDTDYILSKCRLLKNTSFAISRDFPVEIADARRELWPTYKDLRKKHPRDKISIVYPAKLVHNNHVIRDMFPDWWKIMRGRRVTNTTTTQGIQQTIQTNADETVSRASREPCDQPTCVKSTYLHETTVCNSTIESVSCCSDVPVVDVSSADNSKAVNQPVTLPDTSSPMDTLSNTKDRDANPLPLDLSVAATPSTTPPINDNPPAEDPPDNSDGPTTPTDPVVKQ